MPPQKGVYIKQDYYFAINPVVTALEQILGCVYSELKSQSYFLYKKEPASDKIRVAYIVNWQNHRSTVRGPLVNSFKITPVYGAPSINEAAKKTIEDRISELNSGNLNHQ